MQKQEQQVQKNISDAPPDASRVLSSPHGPKPPTEAVTSGTYKRDVIRDPHALSGSVPAHARAIVFSIDRAAQHTRARTVGLTGRRPSSPPKLARPGRSIGTRAAAARPALV